MAIISAILFLVIAVALLLLYNGTPHGGPTAICGPITFFNYTFDLNTDCRYVSIGELAGAFAFFFLAILSVNAARPRQGP